MSNLPIQINTVSNTGLVICGFQPQTMLSDGKIFHHRSTAPNKAKKLTNKKRLTPKGKNI